MHDGQQDTDVRCVLRIGNVRLKQMQMFEYVGKLLTDDRKCDSELRYCTKYQKCLPKTIKRILKLYIIFYLIQDFNCKFNFELAVKRNQNRNK